MLTVRPGISFLLTWSLIFGLGLGFGFGFGFALCFGGILADWLVTRTDVRAG